MICARCARQVAAGAPECPNCAGDPLLDGRYRLDSELSSDSIGVSYRATRLADGMLVRARACMVRRLAREPELGDRLAQLRGLEHASLPRRLDEFVTGDESLATQWLIDEQIAGHTLADAIAAAPKGRLDRARLLAGLAELADLLAYLHRQPTPIVHGALTPKVILLRSEPAGACLLDLALPSGAVHGASTLGLADSLGFTAPEQLYADATPASDVWALGAITLVALTGASLSSLRDSSLALRWRDRVEVDLVDPRVATVLERMLQPDPSQRITATELTTALAELKMPERRGATQHHPWTPTKPPRARAGHHPPRTKPKPIPPRADARERKPRVKPDVPVSRPEELSRELSQAHQVAVALEQQQRSQLALARVLVVLIAAIIAALATYIALSPG